MKGEGEAVRVLLPIPGRSLFDYHAPEGVTVARGQLVEVMLQHRRMVGVVWATAVKPEVPEARLRPLLEVWDDWPALEEGLLDQIAFAAEYYLNAPGEYLAFTLPPALRRRGSRGREAARTAVEAEPSEPQRMTERPLSPAQDQALAELRRKRSEFDPVLLFGVTGSGKTELYRRLVAETVSAGQQALVLVPEIGLVPQTFARLASAVPEGRAVVLHSGLSAGERTRGFAALVAGAVDLLVGTRLAIFAPMPRLGLIVVDEEHDPSYRQFEGAPFSARDLALWRGQRVKGQVVLGSATPSLERWYDAERGRIRRVCMRVRASGVPLPRVVQVSVTGGEAGGLAPVVWAEMERTLAREEQVLIFLNRRGYAPTLFCSHCGWVAGCSHCSARLVYHRVDERLRCHHCGGTTQVPRACPQCGDPALAISGRGTQQLQEALTLRFPTVPVVRLDRDARPSPAAFAALRAQAEGGGALLLVGTQMVAKGHDFPALSLVVVVDADAGLLAADWRASEQLMQVLMQVAGRAGRTGQAGQVLVQTRFPNHPFFSWLLQHDYEGFAAATLAERARLRLPPFAYQALLRASAPSLMSVMAFLTSAREGALQLRQQRPEWQTVRVADVVPMRVARLADRERAQLLLEAEERRSLRSFLAEWYRGLALLPRSGDLRWRLEVDPLET
ncbi:MAG: primosomal protein N' [Hydrogenophilus sp.]|nr:primosomal protein N' [Hydrogenophilus sp.]